MKQVDLSLWHEFKRQRMNAWQPIPTPSFMVPLYLSCGVLFWLAGFAMLISKALAQEYRHDYTDSPLNDDNVGSEVISLSVDMEPPVWVYYELDGFFQNHRRYHKSYSGKQLKLADAYEREEEIEADITKCCEQQGAAADGRSIYPCGLVPANVFNDTFVLLEQEPGTAANWNRVDIIDDASAIAWPADLAEGKFKNKDPEAVPPGQKLQNQALMDMWILGRYPPVECKQTDFSDNKPYVPVRVAMKSIAVPGGGSAMVADCTGYMDKDSTPTCNFTRQNDAFVCAGGYEKEFRRDWGTETGHLMVWMRIAGLPTFRKLWGRIDQKLEKEKTYKIVWNDEYPVKVFRGRKAIVLATTSIWGGQSDQLGYGYMLTGGACFVFGVWQLVQCLYCPRPLGDVSLLSPAS